MTTEPTAAELPSDPASDALGIRILALARGTCTARMRVRPDMTNGHGICHGGVVFTLADSACGLACNFDSDPAVSASSAIEFLAPARVGDELTAVVTERWRGTRGGVFDVAVTNQDGQAVALLRCRARQFSERR